MCLCMEQRVQTARITHGYLYAPRGAVYSTPLPCEPRHAVPHIFGTFHLLRNVYSPIKLLWLPLPVSERYLRVC